jgi:hypothetical protein
MQVLGATTRRRFEERMLQHMRVRSRLGLAEPELRERTRRLIAGAEHYGIEAEADIRRFLELVFDRVPSAVQDPEVLAVLGTPGTSGSAKVAFIADILSSQHASRGQ